MALSADSTQNYIPLQPIYGKKNSDGSYTLSALDIKNLNDNLYAIAQKIQGGLTFKDLTKTAGTQISDMNGNISTLNQTADELAIEVESVAARNTVTINANGMFVTNQNGQTTQLTGDHIKSGTIEGVTLISADSGHQVRITTGQIILGSGYEECAIIYYSPSDEKLRIENSGAIKITASDNLSIDSGGTVYIGSSEDAANDVFIGRMNGGGRIDLYGDVYVNGSQI